MEEKYKALKMRFLKSIDVSFRLGYEKGYADAKQEMMQRQIQELQQKNMEQQTKMDQQQAKLGEFEISSAGGNTEGGNVTPTKTRIGYAKAKEDAKVSIDTAQEDEEVQKSLHELKLMVSKGSKPSVKELRSVVEKLEKSLSSASQQDLSLSGLEDIKKSEVSQQVDSIIDKWEKEEESSLLKEDEFIDVSALQEAIENIEK